ncbi:MAG: hypothetical protein JW839_12480 [Candidatus Lokiarchaeota archaeon]|nr:hypothetical protein [Candidatus Lokiarchaeota archaeon]
MNKKTVWRVVWKIIHVAIIVNFIVEIAYCGYQVFGVLGGGPLFDAVLTIDMDLFLKRRLYAIETWIAIAGLAIYLAITEILPQMKKEAAAARVNGSP